MVTKEEKDKLNKFLDMSIEEFETINATIKKDGTNKEAARRMIFFTAGFAFIFGGLGYDKIIHSLDYPDKDIAMFKIQDILKLVAKQKQEQGV